MGDDFNLFTRLIKEAYNVASTRGHGPVVSAWTIPGVRKIECNLSKGRVDNVLKRIKDISGMNVRARWTAKTLPNGFMSKKKKPTFYLGPEDGFCDAEVFTYGKAESRIAGRVLTVHGDLIIVTTPKSKWACSAFEAYRVIDGQAMIDRIEATRVESPVSA